MSLLFTARAEALLVSPTSLRISPRLAFAPALALALTLALAAACPVSAAEYPGSLATLAPADVGLAIEGHGLAEQARAVQAGELFRRWQAFPPLARWRDQTMPAWRFLSAELSKELGSSAEELLVQLLGREALLGVWPAEAATPEEPPTLLLVRGDAAYLSQLVDRVCAAQDRSGEAVGSRASSHAGVDYRVQVLEREGRETSICFAVFDDVGAVAGSEEILRKVLELRAARVSLSDPVAAKSLADLPAYRAASERIAADAAVRLFVNPRPWDAHFQAESLPADDRWLADAWQAAEYWVAGLEVGSRTAVESHIRFSPERLTAPLREALASLSGETRFFDRVPETALAAAAGRIDVARFIRALAPKPPAGQPDPAAGVLFGWTWISQSLGGLGPEAGAYLLAASADDVAADASADATAAEAEAAPPLPIDWIIAARVNDNASRGGAPRTADELHIALRSALALAAQAYNDGGEGRQAEVVPGEIAGIKLLSISGLGELPAGMAPTFAIVENWLWGVGSPELLETATEGPARPLSRGAAIARLASPRMAPGHIVYLDLAGLRRLIDRHREAVLAQAEADRGMNPQQAQQSLQQLLSLLRLADAGLFAAEFREDGVSFSLAASAEVD